MSRVFFRRQWKCTRLKLYYLPSHWLELNIYLSGTKALYFPLIRRLNMQMYSVVTELQWWYEWDHCYHYHGKEDLGQKSRKVLVLGQKGGVESIWGLSYRGKWSPTVNFWLIIFTNASPIYLHLCTRQLEVVRGPKVFISWTVFEQKFSSVQCPIRVPSRGHLLYFFIRVSW